ncbi:hypothetical protein P7K49_012321 [Saguinus oedipus]|uniref:Uncharacterized protein n=1 Tax=Saguinus oedipus TaxID=9490 RepID=A0ABQ9VT55_SAGOE|nr:hypothetical protein P7K49_012321 [Saguinus oedipus]
MGCGSRSFLTPSPGAKRDARAQADRALPWSDFAHESSCPAHGRCAVKGCPGRPSPVFGSPHLLAKKDHWLQPSRKAKPGLSLHDRRSSGSEDSILDLRYRLRVIDRDDQDQDVLDSNASDFSDTSGEDSGDSSVVKV